MKRISAIFLMITASSSWFAAAPAQRASPPANTSASTGRADPAAPRIVAEAERALRSPPLQVPQEQLELLRRQVVTQHLATSAFNLVDDRLIYSPGRQPSGGWLSIAGIRVTLSNGNGHAQGSGSEPVSVALGMAASAQGLHLIECRTPGLDRAAWTLTKPGIVAYGTATHQNGVHMFVVDIPAVGSERPALNITFSNTSGGLSFRTFESCEIRKIEN